MERISSELSELGIVTQLPKDESENDSDESNVKNPSLSGEESILEEPLVVVILLLKESDAIKELFEALIDDEPSMVVEVDPFDVEVDPFDVEVELIDES